MFFIIGYREYDKGNPPLGTSDIALVFGPELVSYERSRLIDRWVLREIPARLFGESLNT